ncbi:uncharacterized protein LOC100571979 [Acyrthosiphon pisum]|uniref:DDE-1 domain-containing protein n=1 Tax=Acyrthosiphon pisum TaxID=7029 RepID=A0A8R2A4Z8_ACYPI|nr:uncharacterized protein LOC100571979 [Acyrthosiphon pisum]|eukprot:XP_003240827.1 PREDICTED: uncharacterized protein LOC100571979 [Acyrthosiphon pisum]
MPRKYERTSVRKSWENKDMEVAILDVTRKVLSVNAAALKYKIPEPTLRRYLKKRIHPLEGEEFRIEFPQNLGRFKKTFSAAQVEELKQYVTDIDKRAFGLSRKQFANVCFDYAEKNGVTHRFNTEKKSAGEGFIREFMRECGLTMRKPESTSVARLMAFNRVNVSNFFELLRDVRLKYSFTAEQIYNVDETGFSTVATKTPKVITPVGTRRVIKISSAERGVTVTCVCAMSATGYYIPPFFIYPRVRMNPKFLEGAPPGSAAVPHISGWMTATNFVNYLKHFSSHTRPSTQRPVLLLMDNHASHVTLEAITFCRENGIVMLGFPPHTSHRLQPLDVGFYGPLKTSYSQACDDFLVSNPGICISITHIPKIFGTAYLKVATIQTAVNAFRATGIEPYDSNIFRDEDFQPSLTTDIQSVESTAPAFERQPEILFENTNSAISPTANDSFENQHPQPQTELTPSTSSALSPLPVASKKTARKPRKKLPSFLLSGTPVKEALEQKRKEQEEKELKRQKRLTEKSKKKKARRQLDFPSSSDDEPSIPVPYIDTDDDMDPPEEEDKLCIICSEEGKDEL